MSENHKSSPEKTRALVIYFHRFAIEFEVIQFPGLKAMLDALLKKYDVLYFSMRSTIPVDNHLRSRLGIREIPLRVNTISARDKWIKTALYYALLPITLARLRRLKPSFIICKETMPFVPAMVGLLRIPMSIDASDWWWSILLGRWKWGKALAQWLERIEIRLWNRSGAVVIAHSNAEAEVVQKNGMSPGQVRIINAPLNRELYFPCDARQERIKLGFTESDFVVAVHGIIHPSKGYDQIFEWWKRLTHLHPNWKLLVIGGAGGEKWCSRQIQQLRMERSIIMSGWLPTQSDVNRYLNAADCLLVTRRNTSDNRGVIPSALYHALATAKPTVATGLPGMAEVLRHGVNGYLYEPDSYESFRVVLESIANHPDKARKVGQAGPAHAEQCFSPELAASKFLDIVVGSMDGREK